MTLSALFVSSHVFVGADAHIGPYNMLCRILTAEYSQNEQNRN